MEAWRSEESENDYIKKREDFHLKQVKIFKGSKTSDLFEQNFLLGFKRRLFDLPRDIFDKLQGALWFPQEVRFEILPICFSFLAFNTLPLG